MGNPGSDAVFRQRGGLDGVAELLVTAAANGAVTVIRQHAAHARGQRRHAIARNQETGHVEQVQEHLVAVTAGQNG